jgi:hypothetical protein
MVQEARRRSRAAAAAGVALVAVGALALGAQATFTAQATPTHATDTGDMELTLGSPGPAHRIATASGDLVPGDTVQRTIRLTVDDEGGTMSGITMTTSGSGSPSFVTDATNGLKLWLARCSQQWTESGSAPGYTYSCGATQNDVLGTAAAPVPFVQTAVDLSAGLDTADNAVNYLMAKLTLPASAPDSMEGQSSTLSFAFEGTQRAGTNK